MKESLTYSVHHEESFSLTRRRKENVAGCSLIQASQVTDSLSFFFIVFVWILALGSFEVVSKVLSKRVLTPI